MKKIAKIFVFILPILFFSFIAYYLKGYRIELVQNGIIMSPETECEYWCLEGIVISLATFPIAIYLIGWAKSFSDWTNKKVSNLLGVYGWSLVPSPWMLRIFGIVIILVDFWAFTSNCNCR